MLAGAPGFEPGNGGIKIQVVRVIYQCAFRKIAEIENANSASASNIVRFSGCLNERTCSPADSDVGNEDPEHSGPAGASSGRHYHRGAAMKARGRRWGTPAGYGVAA
jgi:hypothetical protein